MSDRKSYRFAFKCSYLNRVWFEVRGDGEPYEIRYRHCLCDYEAKIYNGGPARYREIEGPLVGLLMREHCYRQPRLSDDLVRAFNAWRIQAALEADAYFAARPEVYGDDREPTKPDTIATGSAHFEYGYQFYPLQPEQMAA